MYNNQDSRSLKDLVEMNLCYNGEIRNCPDEGKLTKEEIALGLANDDISWTCSNDTNVYSVQC